MSESGITEVLKIGDNSHGYWFGVGKYGSRWVGFAVSVVGEGRTGIFFLPGISEDYQLGLSDREKCIRMTGAVAQSPEHGYGGIERWYIGEELRGTPEEFRCAECGEFGCSGDHF